MKSKRVQDFEVRAKTSDERYQLIALRNGEIQAMRFHSTEYQQDRRHKKLYKAYEENCLWIQEINEALGINGYKELYNEDEWKVAFGYL